MGGNEIISIALSTGTRIAQQIVMTRDLIDWAISIIKHIDIEGPGLIEYCLKQEKIPYQIVNLETGSRLPKINDLSHIVILGGPMNVYEEDRYPFLKDEDLFIKEAIQRGKFILGKGVMR